LNRFGTETTSKTCSLRIAYFCSMKEASELRIVFMGTPDFAVATLRALCDAGMNIVGVVTAPDKPAGRGMKIQESAVKRFAVERKLVVLQPDKLKSPDFLQQLRDLNADLQVIVAFRMLPELVWNMPPMGSVNLHGSLLPQYRGAAPINWAIINGEKETGVTSFQLQHEIDTGNILLQKIIPIGPDETAGELHDQMMVIGAALVVETVKGLASQSIEPKAQSKPDGELKEAPKIFSDTCAINAHQNRQQVHDFIRGLSPYPGAFTYLNASMIKIYRSQIPQDSPCDPAPGVFMPCNKDRLFFGCADGPIEILELQLSGKKKMNAADFVRGYRFER